MFLWDHLALRISSLSTFECLSQSLRKLVCISWHLSLSQRCNSYILTSVSVSVFVTRIIATQPFCTTTNEYSHNFRQTWRVVFYEIRSRRIILCGIFFSPSVSDSGIDASLAQQHVTHWFKLRNVQFLFCRTDGCKVVEIMFHWTRNVFDFSLQLSFQNCFAWTNIQRVMLLVELL
jgi:hypothetical protein